MCGTLSISIMRPTSLVLAARQAPEAFPPLAPGVGSFASGPNRVTGESTPAKSEGDGAPGRRGS